jgi:hypothetical protein
MRRSSIRERLREQGVVGRVDGAEVEVRATVTGAGDDRRVERTQPLEVVTVDDQTE